MILFSRKQSIVMRLQSPAPKARRSFLSRCAHAVLWVPYTAGLILVTGVGSLFWLLASLCHFFGLVLIWPPKTIVRSLGALWRWFLADVDNTANWAPQRLASARSRQFSAGLVLFACLAILSFGVLRAGNLFAEGLELKGRILGQATSAVKLLENGQSQIGEDNVEGASRRFGLAIEYFKKGQQAFDDSSIIIKTLSSIVPQGKDTQNLLKAGTAGSQAAAELASLSAALEKITFNDTGLFSLDSTVAFTDVAQHFANVKANTTEAIRYFRKVSASRVPEQYREKFVTLQGQLEGFETALDTLEKAFSVVNTLSTGSKHILVLLQNSNELRPTGGFAGTYGAFMLASGRVQKQTISSIYDLDGQLQTKYIPPLPLFAVNNRWFLRDSNWFASFPESAEAVIGFYEQETHTTPDLVIAITPQLATRLLKLTGPISIPGYSTTLDADNFVEVTQVETSVYYDREKNKPKKMLADFFPIFLARIAAGFREEPVKYVDALRESLEAGDVLAYSRDARLEKTFRELSWDGGLAVTGRDYLSIISANLGGTKTDLSIKQEASLVSKIAQDGSVQNTLRITRTNPLPKLAGLENKTFMRVLVPLGSKLVSSKGFSYVDLDVKYGEQGEIHPQVAEWEQAAVKEVGSGMLVGVEGDKTFFGNWVNLEGGQSAELELVYTLPWRIATLDRDSLVVQKQPGANSYDLQYTLNLGGRRILWATDKVAAGASVSRELTIDRDRFFGVVLESSKRQNPNYK